MKRKKPRNDWRRIVIAQALTVEGYPERVIAAVMCDVPDDDKTPLTVSLEDQITDAREMANEERERLIGELESEMLEYEREAHSKREALAQLRESVGREVAR